MSSGLHWEVARPWARFLRELVLAGVWFGLVAVLLLWAGGEPWMLLVLVVAGAYVLGPLFVSVTMRLEEAGVVRASRFGTRTFPWSDFRGFTVGRGGRTAFLQRRGGWAGRLRGPVTLFLPEDAAQRDEALQVLEGRLERLQPSGGAR